jgi:putative FmdB family regulatory protein
MPLYEYACEKCGKVFEVIEKFSDKPLTVHAECGGKVERLLSAPALHFKGSGFYITDYAKGNGNANAPKSSEKNSEKSSDKSSDASKKSETKTESVAPAAAPAPAAASSSSDSKS